MLYSRLFGKSVRQVPRDARATSYRLLLQGGFVRSLGQGLFTFTPLGMRVVKNIKHVIRQEMEEIGAQEVLAPLVNPREIWEESGRDELIEEAMIRFQDRKGHRLVLAPTHEEAMVELVRQGIRSYRDLPIILYQIQSKFRDEARVRCGLVRTREFIMKDAYSFHSTFTDLNGFFPRMFATYRSIFQRCRVPVIPAQAGVGYMGGDRSYEFLMPCECGDDYLIQCDTCGYAANEEVAVGDCPVHEGETHPIEAVEAPPEDDMRSLNALRQYLEIPRSRMAKAMLYRAADAVVMAVVRGDHEVSEEKLTQVLKKPILGRAGDDILAELQVPGPWLSPIDLPRRDRVHVVVDEVLAAETSLFAGCNRPGAGYVNARFGRDFTADRVADVIRVPEGSGCRHCSDGTLRRMRAMELGNVFRLGTFYTQAMNLHVNDEHGRRVFPHMGSYGIGIGRLLAAVVEANHDERGIVWPPELAPFSVFLMSIGKSLSVRRTADELYRDLQGFTLYDDRYESISHKLKDADLLGIPIRVVVSRESVSEGLVEVARRTGAEPIKVPREDLVATIRTLLEELEDV
ncbi:MAG: proline--tRNA ligase [Spirochaetaceae bacterium]|nr:MAG: proline--tRNA ligase [Spirochaetaceae bacterium]